MSYSPQGRRESDSAERLNTHTHTPATLAPEHSCRSFSLLLQLEDLLSQILTLELLGMFLNAVPTPASHPGPKEGQHPPRVSLTSSLRAPLHLYVPGSSWACPLRALERSAWLPSVLP